MQQKSNPKSHFRQSIATSQPYHELKEILHYLRVQVEVWGNFTENEKRSEIKVYVAFVLLFPEELLCYFEENYHIVQDYETEGYYQILSYYYMIWIMKHSSIEVN